jgi:DNA polymerase III sliding clamp (beta) subunit (PCNA family)
MKVVKTYRKDCALYWNVYITCICNILILSDYYVTIKNELPAIFASLGIEVAECSILSEIIGRVPVNSVELH